MDKQCYLIIDIGNSRIKLAVFRDDQIVFHKSYDKVLVRDLNTIRKKYPFENAIYSSVRKSQPGFVQHLKKNYHLLQLTSRTKIPLKNNYKTPGTLGMDRLATVIAANDLYPGKNNLVIDMGTCLKYDFVDKKGVYHGGNIAPGLEMRLESMHILTSKLPRVKRALPKELLGRTTREAMQNGAVLGIKLEIERFIKTLTAERGKINTILTGGDSKYFGEILESKIFVLPELVLFGLYKALRYNL